MLQIPQCHGQGSNLLAYITRRTKESFLSDDILAWKITQRKHDVKKGTSAPWSPLSDDITPQISCWREKEKFMKNEVYLLVVHKIHMQPLSKIWTRKVEMMGNV